MLTAQDIMTRQVHAVTEETTVEELARLFVETGVSAMPVLDEDGHLTGIVTETDLIEQDKPLHIPTVISLFDWVIYLESEKSFQKEVRKITARKVGAICAKDVVTCSSGTPVPEVADLMVKHKVHLVPVVNSERKVLGVVARLDIIRSLGR